MTIEEIEEKLKELAAAKTELYNQIGELKNKVREIGNQEYHLKVACPHPRERQIYTLGGEYPYCTVCNGEVYSE